MNILIIRFSSLGDLVTLEPTFRSFREFFKNDKITFLTTAVGRGLYQDTNYFDEYIINDSVISSVNKLKNYKFDILFNLQCTKPSHYISLLVNTKIRINSVYNLWQKILGIKVKSKTIREMLELTDLYKKTQLDDYFTSFDSDILMPYSKERIFLNKLNNKKYVAISTGTSERWLSKKWGVRNYLELIKRLVEENIIVVLVGSNLELDDEKYINNNITSKIVSFVDKTNLTELKKILSEVDLFIGNDSGPAHIAAGVGTSTITIFGSTDKKHSPCFQAYKNVHSYIIPKKEISCHPCYKTKCPTKMECMNSITVDDIMNLVQERI